MKIPKSVVTILQGGGIGVMPTDTLYGLVGQAEKPETVARIFTVRKRNPRKPFIILISDVSDVELFGVKLTAQEKDILARFWPGPISVILTCSSKKFAYLHRGKKSLAFRLAKAKWLRALIKKTGPLVAPSANPSGLPVADTVLAAKKYFKKEIDFYLSGKTLAGLPSTVVRVKSGKVSVEREGVVSEEAIRKMVS